MLCNMLYNTKFHCPSAAPSRALLGPTVALALIEISPTLLQLPLQGLSRLLPAGTSPLQPQIPFLAGPSRNATSKG